jgi:Tol biopolymer transport system component/DNA-binding winged helix-turn-helix (wHTH) protein
VESGGCRNIRRGICRQETVIPLLIGNKRDSRLDDLILLLHWPPNSATLPRYGEMMPVNSKPVRFGLFELDLHSGELSKNGHKSKLQDQPFRVLSLLLEARGGIITRERLKEALWTGDTFVDFDHSLNAAIAKLRQALGDSAESPRFIETVARRGYRFIAPVTGLEAACVSETLPIYKPKSSRRLVLVCLSAAGAIVAAVGLWFLSKGAASRRMPTGGSLSQLTNDSGLAMDPAVSPDGKLLAYASDRADGKNLNIWIEQLDPPGNAVQLTHEEADTNQPSFSQDGTEIAFRSARGGGGVYVIPTIGGQATRVASAGRNPQFSPDGRWIVYWTGINDTSIVTGSAGGELSIIPAVGGQARRIGVDIPAEGDPVWSPDSRHVLAFRPPEVSASEADIDWWMVSTDGKPSRRTGIFDVLRQQGFSFGMNRMPHLSQWTQDSILFSASYDDAVSVWRMPVSPSGVSRGRAQRLTSGTALEVSPQLTAGGDLIFAGLNLNTSVWALPIDANHAQITGELKRLTEGPMEIMPSISRDGKKLAFTSSWRGEPAGGHIIHSNVRSERASRLQVRVRDLATGKDFGVASFEITDNLSLFGKTHPQISHDGALTAYTANERGDIYIARLGGDSPYKVAGDAKAMVWDWSYDNKRLLFTNVRDLHLNQLDVLSGRQSLFLQKSGYDLFQSKFAPDGRAVALIGCDAQRSVSDCRIFVAPLKGDGSPEPEGWAEIDHPSPWDDKARWSPDSGTIYFVSDRDGHYCLWSQALNRTSKRLAGKPVPLYHFHNSRLAMINVGIGMLEIDVSRDKIVMGLGELTGNIWRLKRGENRVD